MTKLKAIPIVDSSQVEVMRHIYNENLDSLSTKQLPYRNYEDQQQWWETNKHVLTGFLYEAIDRPDVCVGFLVLRDRGEFCTPTIALRQQDWGKGYGKEIVYDYIEKANGPMAGSQLKSNAAICHLNQKTGWQILGEREEEKGTVELLFHPGINPDRKISSAGFATVLDYLNIKNLSTDNHKSIHSK